MILINDRSANVLREIYEAKSRALSRIGGIMAEYAKEYAPVVTGRLRDSISYNADDGILTVGAEADYAPYVELGVLGRAGKHFLRNAAALHMNEYAAVFSEELGEAVLKGGEKNGTMETKEEGE